MIRHLRRRLASSLSVRLQTALVFGGLAVLLCAALAFVLGAMLEREVRLATERSLDATAQQAARTLADGMVQRLRETQVMADSSELWREGLDSPTAALALARMQAARPISTWIGLADTNGRVLSATAGILVGRDISKRPWFGQGLRGAHVGDVHRAELLEKLLPKSASGEPIRFVDFAAPIKVDGRLIGVLGVHGTWDWSREVIASLMPADAAARGLSVYIFDRSGALLLAPSAGAGRLAPATLGELKPDALGAGVMTWPDGQAYLTAVAAMPPRSAVTDMGWQIVTREPAAAAFAPARLAFRQALAVGVFIAILAGGLAWFAAGLLSRPLTAIAKAARDVHDDVPGARIPVLGSNRETRHLSTVLSAMTQRLHATIQAAPVGICRTDAEGRLLSANRRLCEILGSEDSDLLQRPLFELAAEPDAELLRTDLLRLGRPSLPSLSRELSMRRAEGGPVSVVLSASLVPPSDGEAAYAIVAIEDITQRKAAEAAERANAAKTAFLSQVSHELRTPLNAVLGFSQLMQMDQRETLLPGQTTRVKAIADAGRHLLAMINDLLDLTRIESDRLSLSTEPVSLPVVIEQSVAMVAELARSSEVTLELAPPGSASQDCVRADHVRLRQVLMNLLSNAIKYNRAGGNVTVAWAAVKQATAIELTVTDTGPGMRPEKLARLFEPFNRLGAESSSIQGTGIGLVITRKLVRLMGGEIEVSSEAGVGSRFSVVLPIDQPAAGAVSRATEFEMLSPAEPGGLRARTLLYVEDNELNIELVSGAFELRPEVRLLIARSGTEALALALKSPPDVFLLDMHLGDMTGLELARRLRRLTPFRETPMLALSADATPHAVEAATNAGIDSYLTKPLDLRELMKCLERYPATAACRA